MKRWFDTSALLRAPRGLVPWLRWLVLMLAWTAVAATLPLLSIHPAPFPPAVASFGACVLLAPTWGCVYRARRVPAWVDAAVPIALLVVALRLGSLVHALPLALSAVAFRGLWGSRRGVVAAVAVHASAFVLAAAVSLVTLEPAWAAEEIVVGVLLLLLVGLAAHEIASHLAVHDRVARHRRALTDAVGALVGAAEPPAIADVILEALRAQFGPDAAVAVAVARDQGLEVVARHDLAGVLPVGPGLRRAALPEDVRRGLERGEPFHTRSGPDGFPWATGDRQLLVAPLTSRGGLRGAAFVDVAALPEDALTVLGAIVSEGALALESATLTADLRISETRFRSLVQNSSDLIAIVTEAATIRYVSPAARHVLGYHPERLLGADLLTLVHPDDLPVLRHFLRGDLATSARWSTTCRLQHRSGAWRHTEVVATDARGEPGVQGIVLNMRDVTAQKALEADLRRQASHDALTGLPNRALFMDRVRATLADPRHRRVAVLFLDLDNFKLVNDRFGHAVGDELICSVATRLQASLNGHTLARLGGDEFAVLADVPGGRQEVEALAQQVLDALDRPLLEHPEELRSRASVGVALGDSGVDDAGDLLRRADLAMYVAKGEGKARYAVFDAFTYDSFDVQRRLQSDLGAALDAGELEVRYQPVVDLDTLEICSAEALVRWHHPTYGLLGPATFVHLAEAEGLVTKLFVHVLREACLQARSWERNLASGGRVAVSVNLAAQQLHDEALVDLVADAIEGSGLPAELLTLEITENVLVTDPRRAAGVMARLKQLGVALAVDDFGTGYSSLAYLRRLPVDVIKIDRAFVEGLGQAAGESALVRTIVELGRELGLSTVAEGVELAEQREVLQRLGCPYAQGFLFSRPVSAPHFRALLAAGGVLAAGGAPLPRV